MKNTYETPLNSRYASKEMQYIFSPDRKFTTWRKLWVALAESEMELGLPITREQVDELKAHVEDIDYEAARRHEERVRVHSQAAATRMKQEGLESDLLERIAADPAFPMSHEQLTELLAPEKYTGRAEAQTERFITEVVDPILEQQKARAIGEIQI